MKNSLLDNFKELLFIFSGDNSRIIRQCDYSIQKRFLSIGGCVLFILVFCFVSSLYAFVEMFDALFVGFLLSLFLSFTITNIYLLLLYTLAKNTLPHVAKKGAAFLSRGIRVGFVCFISIIVSKPIETLIYSSKLDEDIEEFKTNTILANRDSIIYHTNFKISEINTLAFSEIEKTQIADSLIKIGYQDIKSVVKLVQSSNYFLQRIIFLHTKHPTCWLFTIVCMLIFLSPIYFKYLLVDTRYYELKRDIEMRIITVNYFAFKRRYANCFFRLTGKTIEFSEPFIDAPFNTQRKVDNRIFQKEDDLIQELYSG